MPAHFISSSISYLTDCALKRRAKLRNILDLTLIRPSVFCLRPRALDTAAAVLFRDTHAAETAHRNPEDVELPILAGRLHGRNHVTVPGCDFDHGHDRRIR